MKSSASKPERVNRLSESLSPYLLQHARNPIDWYPWGDAALERARREDMPIFLSIGYAACHWCHVMEHEVFEHEDAASLLNEHFVSIKVDREERPDIDEIYMHATQQMTGHGGWPMSLFLTPDTTPFYAATYIPKPEFMQLATQIADKWNTDRDDVAAFAQRIKQSIEQWARGEEPIDQILPIEIRDEVAKLIANYFDMQWGGLASGNNKFPPSMTMELLLRSFRATGNKELLVPVEVTLNKMADGGIHDHLGGGFCRYSTDPQWRVPHFEKMLYDQALVSNIYLDAYQVFHRTQYADVARSIFEYVFRDLQAPSGGFYSSRDADSEGLEGKYYIWTLEEIKRILEPQDATLFADYYNVRADGNWNEQFGHAPAGPKNILYVTDTIESVSTRHAVTPEQCRARLAAARDRLLSQRAQRVPPGLDDKVLTDWNGLMIASCARGAGILNEPRYAEAAQRAAEFILKHMQQDGRLIRTHREGTSNGEAYLSDYAFFIEGLICLYEATFDPKWLREAERLTDVCHEYYHDGEYGGYFFSARDGETLISRTRGARDGAIPSGNSVHALNLLRLSLFLGRSEYRTHAQSIFKAFGRELAQSPTSFDRLLCALDFYYDQPKEIAIAATTWEQLSPLRDAVLSGYLPNKVLAATISSQGTVDSNASPLLKGKSAQDGRACVYLCQNYTCQKPIHTPDEIKGALFLK